MTFTKFSLQLYKKLRPSNIFRVPFHDSNPKLMSLPSIPRPNWFSLLNSTFYHFWLHLPDNWIRLWVQKGLKSQERVKLVSFRIKSWVQPFRRHLRIHQRTTTDLLITATIEPSNFETIYTTSEDTQVLTDSSSKTSLTNKRSETKISSTGRIVNILRLSFNSDFVRFQPIL